MRIYRHILLLLLLAAAMPPRGAAQGDTTVRGNAAAQGDTTVMLGTYYADRFVGRKTACGDIFRQNQYTAAHRTIPFGTYLLVHNPYTGLEIVVRVNDRCPVRGVLDMTKIAVLKLGIKGSRKVRVVTLDPDEGYARWVLQDTLAMSHEEYMAFKDRSPVRRMTPYADSSPRQRPKGGKAPAPAPGPEGRPADTLPTVPLPANTLSVETQEPVAPRLDTPAATGDTAGIRHERLYDLGICIVGSRQAAERAILRLPRNLQGKATIEELPRSKQLRVVLVLATSRSHAIRVQAMLIEDFPDSNLTPHYDKEEKAPK